MAFILALPFSAFLITRLRHTTIQFSRDILPHGRNSFRRNNYHQWQLAVELQTFAAATPFAVN